MKKVFAVILVLAIALTFAGCGSSIPYKEYTVGGISFEIPESWEATQDSDGSISADDSSFQALWVSGVSEDQFEYFGETGMAETLEGMKGISNVSSPTKGKYGSHQAYEYQATAKVDGNYVPHKTLVLQGDESVVVFILVCDHEGNDYDEIYSHLLKSID